MTAGEHFRIFVLRLLARLAAQRGDQIADAIRRPPEIVRIMRPQDDPNPDPVRAEIRIASDSHFRETLLHRSQFRSDLALRQGFGVEGQTVESRAAFQKGRGALQLRPTNQRHAGQNKHILHAKPRRAGHLIGDNLRAFRHVRHAETGLVEFASDAGVMLRHQPRGFGVALEGETKGGGDRSGSDVVMGRSYPSCREEIGVSRSEIIDGLDDLLLPVADDSGFGDFYAPIAKKLRDGGEIRVLRPA